MSVRETILREAFKCASRLDLAGATTVERATLRARRDALAWVIDEMDKEEHPPVVVEEGHTC